jgi:hypothetical protein
VRGHRGGRPPAQQCARRADRRGRRPGVRLEILDHGHSLPTKALLGVIRMMTRQPVVERRQAGALPQGLLRRRRSDPRGDARTIGMVRR